MWHEEGREIFLSPLTSRGNRQQLLKHNEERVIKHLTFDPLLRYIFWWNELEMTIEGINVTVATVAMNEQDEVQVTTFVRSVSVIGELSALLL